MVAVRAIPPLHAIAPGDLAVRRVPFPVAAREGGFATNPAGFTGRLTSYGILAGAVLHPGELMPASLSETALDALLQQVTQQTGKPMVAVPVSLGQSQGFTVPAAGDRVTLFATVSAGQGGGGGAYGPQAAEIVSRARVLSVSPSRQQLPHALCGRQASRGGLAAVVHLSVDARRRVRHGAAGLGCDRHLVGGGRRARRGILRAGVAAERAPVWPTPAQREVAARPVLPRYSHRSRNAKASVRMPSVSTWPTS